jgi:hypothetical protein
MPDAEMLISTRYIDSAALTLLSLNMCLTEQIRAFLVGRIMAITTPLA